jgi:hypothetical protein
MSNSDASSYTLRYNEISTHLEYANGGNWYQVPSSGGGTPGGTNGELQYNHAGAFGGDTATTDGAGNITATSLTLTGPRMDFTSNGNDYELTAPSGLSGANSFVLPPTLGTSGQVLSTDGVGNTNWISSSGSPNVEQFIDNGFTGTTSSTYAPTTTAVTITPSSTGGQILVMVAGMLQVLSGGIATATLYRGGTQLATGLAQSSEGNPVGASVSMIFLDAPATTSPVTIQSISLIMTVLLKYIGIRRETLFL